MHASSVYVEAWETSRDNFFNGYHISVYSEPSVQAYS